LIINNYQNFIFDLDDTLYDEILYLKHAYNRISEHIAVKFGYSKKIIFSYLISEFLHFGRHKLFDKLLDEFKLRKENINDILNILRTVHFENKLSLNSESYKVLSFLIKNKKRVFIVTNGNIVQQKNKVNNIDWRGFENNINFIYANEFERKPSNMSFLHLVKFFKINRKDTIMIGDSVVDENFAINSKIKFMYIDSFLKKIKLEF
tara:strand:+ start:35 stop:652 length:618 start_codon:yes stop_codon:yes gene_type:complete